MKTKHLVSEKGFSLVEMFVAIFIFMFVIAGAMSTYIKFIHSTTRESELTTISSDVAVSLSLLERDIKMAGFGLPEETRVASHNTCNISVENFCKDNTDRLFVADGWEMLKDITDNGDEDGQIPITPTDYYTKIADKKSGGGYKAELDIDPSATAGWSYIKLQPSLNINYNEECTTGGCSSADDDIQATKSFIIADSTNIKVEGHRITNSIDTTTDPITITFLSNEQSLQNNFLQADSSVAPALAWYIRKDPDGKKYPDNTNIYWLYRNQNRVLPDAEDLQFRFGYDASGNGIEWDDTLPPFNDTGISYDDWAATGPDGETFEFKHLKVIEVRLKVKFFDKKNSKTQITEHITNIELRN